MTTFIVDALCLSDMNNPSFETFAVDSDSVETIKEEVRQAILSTGETTYFFSWKDVTMCKSDFFTNGVFETKDHRFKVYSVDDWLRDNMR